MEKPSEQMDLKGEFMKKYDVLVRCLAKPINEVWL